MSRRRTTRRAALCSVAPFPLRRRIGDDRRGVSWAGVVAAGYDHAGAALAFCALPPALTSAPSATFTTGQAGSFPVATSGCPAPALTESGALPQGVSFIDNGDGTATLSGTPAAGSGGAYTFTITAT